MCAPELFSCLSSKSRSDLIRCLHCRKDILRCYLERHVHHCVVLRTGKLRRLQEMLIGSTFQNQLRHKTEGNLFTMEKLMRLLQCRQAIMRRMCTGINEAVQKTFESKGIDVIQAE